MSLCNPAFDSQRSGRQNPQVRIQWAWWENYRLCSLKTTGKARTNTWGSSLTCAQWPLRVLNNTWGGGALCKKGLMHLIPALRDRRTAVSLRTSWTHYTVRSYFKRRHYIINQSKACLWGGGFVPAASNQKAQRPHPARSSPFSEGWANKFLSRTHAHRHSQDDNAIQFTIWSHHAPIIKKYHISLTVLRNCDLGLKDWKNFPNLGYT